MAFRILRLEKRILFDASIAAVLGAADATGTDGEAIDSADASDVDGVQNSDSLDSYIDVEGEGTAVDMNGSDQETVQVLVISTEVGDVSDLSESALEGVRVVLFDPESTSLETLTSQIQEALDGQLADNLAFATHGQNGLFHLTQDYYVSEQTLADSAALQAFWGDLGNMLEDGGRVDFLGCNIGANDLGLLETLDMLLDSEGRSVSVAASDNLTGNEAYADWTLEYGSVDAMLYFDAEMLAEWEGSLATFTVINTDDSGIGSLRQAIIDANASLNGLTPDVISFSFTSLDTFPDLNGIPIIVLDSALPDITEAVEITALYFDFDGVIYPSVILAGFDPFDLSPTQVVGNGFTLSSDLDSTSAGSTIAGLSIVGFDGYGIVADNIGDPFTDDNLSNDVTTSIYATWIGLAPDIDVTVPTLGVFDDSGLPLSFGNTAGGILLENSASVHMYANTIGSNNGHGIHIRGALEDDNNATTNLVGFNLIGVDGLEGAQPNAGDGVLLENAHDNVVGGVVSGGGVFPEFPSIEVFGNQIIGNAGNGVSIIGEFSEKNTVAANTISGNKFNGVDVRDTVSSNNIGATAIAEQFLSEQDLDTSTLLTEARNVISGHIHGVSFINAQSVQLAGNDILNNATHGVSITGGSSSNIIGIGDEFLPGGDNFIDGNGGTGIDITGSDFNLMMNNKISNGTRDGIRIRDGSFNSIGFALDEMGNLVVSGNAILGNGRNGVSIIGETSTGNTVFGNTITGNGDSGVRLGVDATGNYIGAGALQHQSFSPIADPSIYTPLELDAARNDISGNLDHGVFIDNANENFVQGNDILNNGDNGIHLLNSDGNFIGGPFSWTDNLISGNFNSGVSIERSDSNAVMGNTISENGFYGVLINGGLKNEIGVAFDDAGSLAVFGNTIVNNAWNGVTILGFGGPGGGGPAEGNTVLGNVIEGNVGSGVTIENSLATNNYVGAGALQHLGLDPSIYTFLELEAARNYISDNMIDGVGIYQADNNFVQGNDIVSNDGLGVLIQDGEGNLIGGPLLAQDNFIVENGTGGIGILGGRDNLVMNNVIGGNFGTGVKITDSVFNAIGVAFEPEKGVLEVSGNLISKNLGNGVWITGSSAGANTVLGNLILGNVDSGVLLNDGTSENYIGAAAMRVQPFGAVDPDTILDVSSLQRAYNTISDNDSHGVSIADGDNNLVQGNFIGVPPADLRLRGNASFGVLIVNGNNNWVGGPLVEQNNTIIGNGLGGVGIDFGGTNSVVNNFIEGNFGDGVSIFDSVNNTIGGAVEFGGELFVFGNQIVANEGNGVSIIGLGSTGNTVLGNQIGVGKGDGGGGEPKLLGLIPEPEPEPIPFGNQLNGVYIGDGASNNYIGAEAMRFQLSDFSAVDPNDVLDPRNLGLAYNVIDGNVLNGVMIENANNNYVQGNLIGGFPSEGGGGGPKLLAPEPEPEPEPLFSQGNGHNGVLLVNSSNNFIGGASNVDSDPGTPGLENQFGPLVELNVIIGNRQNGVSIESGSEFNSVNGNFIFGNGWASDPRLVSGLDLEPLGTYAGVYVANSANNTIGGDFNYILGGEVPIIGDADLVALPFLFNPHGGNTISGNVGHGVYFAEFSPNNVVINNRIGMDITGTVTSTKDFGNMGNWADGVFIEGNNFNTRIGGDYDIDPTTIVDVLVLGDRGEPELIQREIGANGEMNVISNNGTPLIEPVGELGRTIMKDNVEQAQFSQGNGVHIILGNSVSIVGNFIGTDVTGLERAGNLFNGVHIERGASVSIGGDNETDRNIISANGLSGVLITPDLLGIVEGGFVSKGGQNRVINNYIGVNLYGENPIEAGTGGVLLAPEDESTIQTLGNLKSGVEIFAIDNQIVTDNVISSNGAVYTLVEVFGSTEVITNAGPFLDTEAFGTLDLRKVFATGFDDGFFLSPMFGNGVHIYTTPFFDDGRGSVIPIFDEPAALAQFISEAGNFGATAIFPTAQDNVVSGNYIGTNADGSIGNQFQDTTVGLDRTVSYNINGNYGSGVFIQYASRNMVSNNVVSGNGNFALFTPEEVVLGGGDGGGEPPKLLEAEGPLPLPDPVIFGQYVAPGGINILGAFIADTTGLEATFTYVGGNNIVAENIVGLDATGSYTLELEFSESETESSQTINVLGNYNSGVAVVNSNMNLVDANLISGNGSIVVDSLNVFPVNNDILLNPVLSRSGVYIAMEPFFFSVIGPIPTTVPVVGPLSINLIIDNIIGLDATGTISDTALLISPAPSEQTEFVLGNQVGVHINGASMNLVDGNLISGNEREGVLVESDVESGLIATDNQISYNKVGTDTTGLLARPNAVLSGTAGIHMSDTAGNVVGRNIVSGNNGDGILITSSEAFLGFVDFFPIWAPEQGDTFMENLIGVDSTGEAPLANLGHGLHIVKGNLNNVLGNRIAYNGGDGVRIEADAISAHENGVSNMLSFNEIYDNAKLGIDLMFTDGTEQGPTPNDGLLDADDGPNDLQNYPEISEVTFQDDGMGLQTLTITFTLETEANTDHVVEFFLNELPDPSGFGEGQLYIGYITALTDATGTVTINAVMDISGLGIVEGDIRHLTATATGINSRSTSEFSAAFEFVAVHDCDDDHKEKRNGKHHKHHDWHKFHNLDQFQPASHGHGDACDDTSDHHDDGEGEPGHAGWNDGTQWWTQLEHGDKSGGGELSGSTVEGESATETESSPDSYWIENDDAGEELMDRQAWFDLISSAANYTIHFHDGLPVMDMFDMAEDTQTEGPAKLNNIASLSQHNVKGAEHLGNVIKAIESAEQDYNDQHVA